MWPNPQKTADLVSFTEEILNWNLHFLCSVLCFKSRVRNPWGTVLYENNCDYSSYIFSYRFAFIAFYPLVETKEIN